MLRMRTVPYCTVQTHAGRDENDRPLSAYSDLLDPLYLLSTPTIKKGLGAIIHSTSPSRSSPSPSPSPYFSSNSYLSESRFDKNEKQKQINLNNRLNSENNFSENTITEIYQNNSTINGNQKGCKNKTGNGILSTENEEKKNEDNDVKINFTQFYHLLLEITEIVYPEIYTDPGSEMHLNSRVMESLTDKGTSRTYALGKTRAFQKILIVSSVVCKTQKYNKIQKIDFNIMINYF